MWKGLSVITDSPSPIVVVLSGSMEPAFQRGDLLFLWNRNVVTETSVGEVVVYSVKGKDIPIVHRIVRKFGKGFVSHLLHPCAVTDIWLTIGLPVLEDPKRSYSQREITMSRMIQSSTQVDRITWLGKTLSGMMILASLVPNMLRLFR